MKKAPALTLSAEVFDGRGTANIVIRNRAGKTVEVVGSVVGVHNLAEALAEWKRHTTVVQSGVKGASRITTTKFADRADAEAFVARVRRSNSIGSYWAQIID